MISNVFFKWQGKLGKRRLELLVRHQSLKNNSALELSKINEQLSTHIF